jgi:hypothetical protein
MKGLAGARQGMLARAGLTSGYSAEAVRLTPAFKEKSASVNLMQWAGLRQSWGLTDVGGRQ